jgi:tetratricopeptide (TPR) repeat protein
MMTKTIFGFLAFALIAGCTPKTPPQITETPTTPTSPAPEETANPCPTFSDAPYPDQALDNFVLYRDFMKTGDWDLAFEKWQKVHTEAPAADGRRTSVFTDGVKFYEHYMMQDTAKKQEYFTKVMALYDEMEHCYPDGGFGTGLKAFDYFFKYPTLLPKEEQYALFKKSIEMDYGEPRFFILNPFTSLLVELTLDEKVPVPEARHYAGAITSTIEKGLAGCEGADCENWKIIQEYAPARLEALESVEGFYDCDYFEAKYYPEFEASPTDCDVIVRTYSRLKWGQCASEDTTFQAVKAAYMEHCYEEPTNPVEECNALLREGKYRGAISCYETLLENMTDNKQKAQITLIIAKIHFAYLKNFPRARQYARRAAALRPGWGEPYMLIGTLYASSGPLCGPGRGWDSQVVVWPAVDMWEKAKSIDPGVAAKANQMISQYTQYMPSGGDIFQHLLKEGDPYFVPCWIQENTIIRAAE